MVVAGVDVKIEVSGCCLSYIAVSWQTMLKNDTGGYRKPGKKYGMCTGLFSLRWSFHWPSRDEGNMQ